MVLDDAPATVSEVFRVVAESAPEIRAGLPGRRVKSGEENVSGEDVMAADLWADELLGDRIGAVDGVGAYASEERETVESTGEGLSVAVDPLDGSSNLKSNNPMGTVVGVYDAELPAPGRDLVAAGFVLYGPITTMVVARGDDVMEYVVGGARPEGAPRDERAGSVARPERPSGAEASERRTGSEATRSSATREQDGEPEPVDPVELPEDPTVYGFGGRVPDWPEAFAEYVGEVESELKLRYGGAMIADVSQVLTYGGIFAYPGLQSRPEGKLRLQFEGAPIGYVVEAAGGASSDGSQSLLDVEAESLHQRVPVHVGNEALVERLQRALE